MAKYNVFFNPYSANGNGRDESKEIKKLLNDVEFIDLTAFKDLKKTFDDLTEDDKIVIAGGDGTLNKVINETNICEIENDIFYYPCGSGNDFYKDLNTEEKTVKINKYLKDLPIVTVKGKDYKFINGVGYGIDGYCCEVGDIERQNSTKEINYASIAVKGLLFHFKPRKAKVTVDGKEYEFKNVWLAPTMNGRYYGGGMNCTPNQDRLNDKRTVSTMVMQGKSRLLTLMIFPSIFKGEHINHKKYVHIFSGKEVKVEFSSPCALQIDGETILDVSEYSVKTK